MGSIECFMRNVRTSNFEYRVGNDISTERVLLPRTLDILPFSLLLFGSTVKWVFYLWTTFCNVTYTHPLPRAISGAISLKFEHQIHKPREDTCGCDGGANIADSLLHNVRISRTVLTYPVF